MLEILEDIPDADVKPYSNIYIYIHFCFKNKIIWLLIKFRPENILFLCKLNPITEEKDLEIIFSKFGTIRTCDIVRDWKTG